MKLRYRILLGALAVFGVILIASAAVLGYSSACTPPPAVAAGTATMKAIVRTCYGPADVLELADLEKPVPGEKEVLVRVRAASVNPLDYHYMRGSPYLMRLASGIGAPDVIQLGVDFAGTVENVGPGVSGFEPGDRVFGGRTGAFAEYLVVDADRGIAAMPDKLSFEQAASVGIAATTALQALRDAGRVESGDKVLINGASGGVGTFAVQIAKSYGAEVSGVCSTRNVELVRSLGADRVFDYKNEDYTDSGERFDLIVDNVGNHSPRKNSGVLEPDGRLILVGGPKGNWFAPLKRPVQAMLTSLFVDQELITFLAELNQDDLVQLVGLMEAGTVTPVIDRVFTLPEVAEAIRYSESGRARGKIIVTID